MLQPLTIAVLKRFCDQLNLLMLCETALTALIPLYPDFPHDHSCNRRSLGSANRRERHPHDTRLRHCRGRAQALTDRSAAIGFDNARLGMSRELVDFLEQEAPAVMASAVQMIIALIVLFAFHPVLFAATCAATVLMIVFSVSHRRFYR